MFLKIYILAVSVSLFFENRCICIGCGRERGRREDEEEGLVAQRQPVVVVPLRRCGAAQALPLALERLVVWHGQPAVASHGAGGLRGGGGGMVGCVGATLWVGQGQQNQRSGGGESTRAREGCLDGIRVASLSSWFPD